MNQFDNYIYHKIALVTYNMYEDNVKSLKSKGIPVKYYSHYDFVKTLSVHFLTVQKAVVNTSIWYDWIKIVSDTKKYFGV
jgi:hypothetical protein